MFNLDRWAIVGVKDETGTGRMSQDLRRCLAPIQHLVAPSYRHEGKPLSEGEERLESNEVSLRDQISKFQGIILFEDTEWGLASIRAAHSLGVRVVFVPMWEWFRSYVPEMKLCSLFACVNGMSSRILKSLGFRNTTRITWPVDISALPNRQIKGAARIFTHNVGLFEKDDRKGTQQTIEAFSCVPNSDIELVIRVQNNLPIDIRDTRIRIESKHLENHSELYQFGDIAVQPSKCEGLGFMILEAIASGLPVITTDYAPMNEYVKYRQLVASTVWGKTNATQSTYISQAHFKIPRISKIARAIAWSASHDLEAVSFANRKWAENTFSPSKVRSEWLDSLQLSN